MGAYAWVPRVAQSIDAPAGYRALMRTGNTIADYPAARGWVMIVALRISVRKRPAAVSEVVDAKNSVKKWVL
jgi:hypothetical protein